MKNPRDILKRPVITEKSMSLLADNKYTFIVDPRANKVEIKKAVEELFKVKVEKVNTMRVKGKTRRVRNVVGRRPEVKKAIVTLRKGDKIELFEGV
ncbi:MULTISPECIES: 50S ribosomal protein L23 [Desulfofundulus]|uniref:Large ribosomal subunit protein uL23 n=1 Tax=Desulfofundulus australicus DSM 11792 TaxID=1121425 RepID=A0A1M4YY37_9FIRM|nr:MULTISPECIES: 50S ribosomal protein L23 [Desulfofundulus]MBE3585272.1 50S ribosomal protein L23 [Thermoanaerobacter sp.]MCS5695171.1 50S ribosomal protein L23 [Desulfofundulus thermocisternus]MDK2888747.1 large subunit ribosomal protein [Thermoanaerobacter sp.]SHF10625.1 large subunit ribosomal protein L23 [Desulfofundulus australicus DSM 11792]